MAYFAEIRTDNNEVLRVIVVNDNDVVNNGGNLSTEAETWVANNHPQDPFILEELGTYPDTYWKQTSKTQEFRVNFASVKGTYDSANDRFLGIKPHASWTPNENGEWKAPVDKPNTKTFDVNTEIFIYKWKESTQEWIGAKSPRYFIWDSNSLTWVENGLEEDWQNG